MKKALLTAIAALGAGMAANAQITLDTSNFKAPQSSVERYKMFKFSGLPASIQHGANVSYDFSTLVDTNFTAADTFSATAYAGPFPSDSRMRKVINSIAGNKVISWAHFNTSAQGYGSIGYHMDRQAFSLKAVTFNPNDSIVFLKQDYAAPDMKYVKFPATYGSHWTTEGKEETNFELTIQAAAMDHTPGMRRVLMSRADSVVGWGTLKVPTTGGASMPYDVLVVRTSTTRTDSFYLGGAPAPDQMLGMFGLSQGATSTSYMYSFYRAGHVNALAEVYTDANWKPMAIYYDPDNTTTDIFQASKPSVAVSAYPNPVNNGTLNLGFTKQEAGQWSVNLTDLTGKLVARQLVNQNGQVRASVSMDAVPAGIYFYSIVNAEGTTVAAGKVMNRK